jgi:peptidoglycan/LPS O-acetylase OafA/YrhL
MFGIGALMTRQHYILAATGRRLKMWSGSLVILAGLVLLTLSWTARDALSTTYRPEQVVGAALLVFAFGYWDRGQAFGGSAALQWLGKRSYSLYLIHYPILVGIAYSLGKNSRFAFLIGIPVALAAADLFFRGVESPSHRLAQKLKRSLTTASPSLSERAAPNYGVRTDS